MFGLFDRETPAIAERLFARAKADAARLHEQGVVVFGQAMSRELPADRIFASVDEVGYVYDDLPEFSFATLRLLDECILTVHGGGRFGGFLLQFSVPDLEGSVSVRPGIRRGIGPKANRLAEYLEKNLGVKNPAKYIERFVGRFER